MAKTISNSSIAVEHDIICKRGDTFSRQFRYWQDKAKTVAVDITESDFNMDVVGSPNLKPIFSFSIGGGLTITDVNVLELDITAMAMQIGEGGNFVYDLQKTLTDGTVVTIMKGAFIIEKDVTIVI